MKVTVKFFASTREIAGKPSLELEVNESSTTKDVIETILQSIPDLKDGIDEVSIAVNKKYVRDVVTLCDGDEVAFLPPMSGG